MADLPIVSNDGAEQVQVWSGNPIAQGYAFASSVTFAANPTDVVTLTGSATKTIKVYSVRASVFSSSSPTEQFVTALMGIRSTADSGGTSSSGFGTALDSNNNASTGKITQYTANPTLGTLVGYVTEVVMPVPSLAITSANSPTNVVELVPTSLLQPITLRGTAQQLFINLSVTVTTGFLVYSVWWTEE